MSQDANGPDRYATKGGSVPQLAGANSNAPRTGFNPTTVPPAVHGPDAQYVEANVRANASAANSNASTSEPASFFRRWASDRLASRRKPEADPEEGIHGELGLHPLHISPDSLIDLVFVHGLKGGSVKTWRKGTDPQCFWPRNWLPRESGFENASIHSFGYDSDWGTTRQSILNVQDFGQALFEELRTNKHLREHFESPIILIGHSMGGLVIKKALISAHQDEKDQALRKRIRSILFLATPHRGSNLGSILKNIMAVSRIPKPFLADVASKSLSAQHINEQFTRCVDGLTIISFYETLPMSVGGLSSVMVVDKSSAILGIKGERSSLMNANHRDICKFDNRQDPNYIKVRDALSAEIAVILHDVVILKREEARSQLEALRGFLGSHPQPDYSYDIAKGTCAWIERRQDFCDWRDAPVLANAQGRSIYWITANPGTGKTLLAAHVISHLQQSKLTCSYYHFQSGKTESLTSGGCLRSIAYQMANSHASVRQVLLRLQQDNTSLDFDDTRGIWANLFKQGILQVKISSPQYWVIDALDECPRYNELLTLLFKEPSNFPLRIFLTSRKVGELQRICQQFGAFVVSVEIPTHNTVEDIEIYLKERLAELPAATDEEKTKLKRTILSKSGSSFLWARLVMQELQGAWTDQTIAEILERIPAGMVPYYQRAFDKIARNQQEMPVVKSILVWTLTAARPLHIDELAHALELDLEKTFPSIATAVEGLCGQLVIIDKKTGLVNFIHTTAREFLLSESAGEFKVDAPSAHELLALACLKLLQSRDLAPPRSQRLIRADRNITQLPLLRYATEYLSDHISRTGSSADILLPQLASFFKSNALTWIERMCQQGDLDGLIRSGNNLSDFVDVQIGYSSITASQKMQVQTVEDWSITLGRLAVQFGPTLLRSPLSIYFIIPPLCPRNTDIHKNFGKSPGGLTVSTAGNDDWEDCIANVTSEAEPPSAFACGKTEVVVGYRTGNIRILRYPSLQQELTLKTDYPVQILHITPDGRHIAVGSLKFLSVWATDSESEEPLWKTRLQSHCLTLASSSTELFGITANGRAWKWDLLSGKTLEEQKLSCKPFNPPPEGDLLLDRAPACASFSPDRQVLALGYSSGPVCLWDFERKDFIDWATDSNDAPCEHLLFNPNPDLPFLLVGYSGSRLSLFGGWSGELICTRNPDGDTRYESVSWSPNGKLFVTVDVSGCLRIWKTSLEPVYQVQTPPAAFRRLGFSSDGRTVIDVADLDLRVWSPSVLVRKNWDSISSPIIGNFRDLSSSRITAICAHPTRAAVFAGTNDGRVLEYEAETGLKCEVYADPRRIYITELAISPRGVLSVADVNRDVRVYQLDNKRTTPEDVRSLRMIFGFNITYPGPITQILFDPSGEYLLTSTAGSDTLYSISMGSCLCSIEYTESRRIWKWFNVPKRKGKPPVTKESQFGLVADGQLRFFSVEDFPTQIGETFALHYKVNDKSVETKINLATMHEPSGVLVLEVCHKLRGITKSAPFVFKKQITEDISEAEPNVSWLPLKQADLDGRISHVIGTVHDHIRGDKLVFLDNHSWVSSVPISSTKTKGCSLGDETPLREYTQHFYVPSEYLSYSQTVPPLLVRDGEAAGAEAVVFCRREDVVFVRRGLKFEEVRNLEED